MIDVSLFTYLPIYLFTYGSIWIARIKGTGIFKEEVQ